LGEQKSPASFDSILRGSSLFDSLWNGLIPNGNPVTKQIRLFSQMPLYLVYDNCYIPLTWIEAILELNVIVSDNLLEYNALVNEAGTSVTDVLSTNAMIEKKSYNIQLVTKGGKPFIEPGQKIYLRMQEVNTVKKENDK
jgi:hypothetical protein